ncbi:unnamed protein product, partial [Mesorhabditis spiculigera]
MRLPSDLIAAVLDQLEPEELIKLHQANKEFRARIARRGLLPGRVRMLRIYGQILAEDHEGVLLKQCEFGVESRGGTMIFASNLSNRIFHVLDKTIPRDAVEPGYPDSLPCKRRLDTEFKLPEKSFRIRWRAFFKPLLRTLERIHAVEELEIHLVTDGQRTIYGMPFDQAYWRHSGAAYARGQIEEVQSGARLKKRIIQIAPLLRALRHIGHCYYDEEANAVFTKTKSFIGGAPASLRICEPAMSWEFDFVPRDTRLIQGSGRARPRAGLIYTLVGFGHRIDFPADGEQYIETIKTLGPVAASWYYRQDETAGGMVVMASVHLREPGCGHDRFALTVKLDE